MDTASPSSSPLLSGVLLGACLCLAAAPAGADSGWGGSLGASSDYVYRGVSLSNNQPSVQLDGHYHGSNDWYAGLGAASTERAADDYYPAASHAVAVNAYLGQGWALGEDWSSSLSLTHYDSRGGEDPGLYRYDELGASLAWRHNVLLSVAASPNISTRTYGSDIWYYQQIPYVYYYVSGSRRGPGYAYELVLNQELPRPELGLHAGLGYRDLKNLEGVGYVYGSAGLAWSHGPWALDLSRIDASHDADQLCCGTPVARRWVLSLVWRR